MLFLRFDLIENVAGKSSWELRPIHPKMNLEKEKIFFRCSAHTHHVGVKSQASELNSDDM